MLSSCKPLIWALQTARVGDNAQVVEVCKRLDGEVVLKPLALNPFHLLPNSVLGSSLMSLTRESAGSLVPPWPDLVVAVGKRTAPIARWIKAASGGKTRLLHLGRPRSRLSDFDLVITTPQYGLPPLPNVQEILLPFAVPRNVLQSEKDYWEKEWSGLPRPWIAVIVGGSKYPLRFGDREHVQLGRAINGLVQGKSGTLLIILSPRSHAKAAKLITRNITAPYRCYPWGAGLPNPYQAALALADQFVVTGESASMMSETVSTQKPVSLFALPLSPLNVQWGAGRGLGAFLASNGYLQPPRNLRRLSKKLLNNGYVSLLGNELPNQRTFERGDEVVVRRVQQLLNTDQDFS